MEPAATKGALGAQLLPTGATNANLLLPSRVFALRHSLALSHSSDVPPVTYCAHSALFWLAPTAIVTGWAALPIVDSSIGTQSFELFACLWHPLFSVSIVAVLFCLWRQALSVPQHYWVGGATIVLYIVDMLFMWSLRGPLTEDSEGKPFLMLASVVLVVVLFFCFMAIYVSCSHRALADRLESRRATVELRQEWTRRKSAAWRERLPAMEGLHSTVGTVDGSGGIMSLARRNLRVTRLIACIVAVIVVMAAYCQGFMWMFVRYATGDPVLQVILHTVFPAPLIALRFVLSGLAGSVDELVLSKERALRPAMIFVAELFQEVFNKNLFSQVTTFSTLAAFEVVVIVRLAFSFPLLMTRRFIKLQNDFWEHWGAKRHVGPLVRGLGRPSDIADCREGLTQNFFFVSMAQRIAMLGYLLNVTVLRVAPDASAYPFSPASMSEAYHERLLTFCIVMAVTDWAISTLIHFVIFYLHGLDSTRVGGRAVVNCRLTLLCSMLVVFVLADVVLALNNLSLS